MALEATPLYQQDIFIHNNNNSINNNDNNNDIYSLLLETYSNTTNIFKDDIIIQQNQEYFSNEIYSNNEFNFLESQLPQQFDWDYCSDNYNHGGVSNFNDGITLSNYDIIPKVDLSMLNNDYYDHNWTLDSSPDTGKSEGGQTTEEVVTRPRRRRAKVEKNKEDVENQRMTHIVVERNRRKQMNEYLNVLRSLMPDSYVQRGDQASIVGGAINFVKELEQNLHCLSAKKHIKDQNQSSYLPFQEFFTFPQYTSIGHGCSIDNDQSQPTGGSGGDGGGLVAEVEVEVTMVESHANLKIRLKWSPKMLSKIVSSLLCLRLTVLHLNVNTAGGFVFYSFSLKVSV
ncbi:hypothetical protein RND81_04G009500 [Saponaria officinalis]|uniref:BHLH domain-containing protein n=1 Tax=Saponaria officinalis TaxID=3572 RepID=A0AAW1LHP8_SAPOF